MKAEDRLDVVDKVHLEEASVRAKDFNVETSGDLSAAKSSIYADKRTVKGKESLSQCYVKADETQVKHGGHHEAKQSELDGGSFLSDGVVYQQQTTMDMSGKIFFSDKAQTSLENVSHKAALFGRLWRQKIAH